MSSITLKLGTMEAMSLLAAAHTTLAKALAKGDEGLPAFQVLRTAADAIGDAVGISPAQADTAIVYSANIFSQWLKDGRVTLPELVNWQTMTAPPRQNAAETAAALAS